MWRIIYNGMHRKHFFSYRTITGDGAISTFNTHHVHHCHRQVDPAHKSTYCSNRGRIRGPNWEKKVLIVFLLAIHCHLEQTWFETGL